MKPPPGMPPPPQDWPPSGGPPWREGNLLKERFLAAPAFDELYQTVYWELYDQLYADGRAVDLLDQVVAAVPVTDGLSRQDLDSAAAELRAWLTERADALGRLRSGRTG